MSDLKKIQIYTDGGSIGNPGPGGYGVIIKYKDKVKEISGGYRLTTNNRMELMAAIAGLSSLKEKCEVTLYTDSQYLANGINEGWAERWKQKGWKRNKKEKAENIDLWDKLLNLISKHEVKIEWIRGHAGHPENERCDKLVREAASKNRLPEDEGYKKELNETQLFN